MFLYIVSNNLTEDDLNLSMNYLLEYEQKRRNQ